MRAPAFLRVRSHCTARRRERGVTMVLVAIAMVAIIAMAALSIDVITLYLAREEAQRSADQAALAAARVISLSGLTGDPANATGSWPPICGGATSAATQSAIAVASQSSVGGAVVVGTTVQYSVGTSAPNTNCAAVTGGFGINPLVTVTVTRTSLPTFFSRIWGNTGNSVSATAIAEAFNSSNSDSVPTTGGTLVPVQPSCVKPWIVPNRDPLNPNDTCGQGGGAACAKFVSTADGSILKKGISLNGLSTTGVIGERFWLAPDCVHTGSSCSLRVNPPDGNYYDVSRRAWLEPPPSLEYLPAEAPITNPVAVPMCANSGSVYEAAVGGCDQSTVYQCGVQSSAASPPVVVDLSENPGAGTNDTLNGVTCMIHQGSPTSAQPDGQDTMNLSAYPFQILSGASSPLLGTGLAGGSVITTSNSIVSLPIYDDLQAPGTVNATGTTNVTIVGFLQVFINSVDQWGNLDVTVLNVSGCGNGTGSIVAPAGVTGTSPVPIRLITPP
jgi:Flp pilus assembly protein TadG